MRSPKVTLRKGSSRDIDQLAIIEREMFRSYYASHRFANAQFAYYVRNPRSIIYVVEAKTDLVGYALGIVGRGRRRTIAKLHSIGVLPQYRLQGLATRLLTAFVGEATRRGAQVVLLEVAAPNVGALHLFRGRHFVTRRALSDHYGKGVNGIQLERRLR